MIDANERRATGNMPNAQLKSQLSRTNKPLLIGWSQFHNNLDMNVLSVELRFALPNLQTAAHVHVCHCCPCARIAHLNISALRYNESCQKRLTTTFSKQPAKLLLPSFKKCCPAHLRWQISDNYTPTFNVFPVFFIFCTFCT